VAASVLIAETASMRLGRTAILALARISSRQFVAASVPDLKRLGAVDGAPVGMLDLWSPTGAVGTVVRVIGLVHRSITSRSLVGLRCPG